MSTSVFARLYDPTLWLAERAGMRRRRAALLAGARGRTLELGSGTGLNLPHYGSAVTELILTEPDPGMRARLAQRAQRARRSAQVSEDRAEALRLPGASVDTVISTLVLCTVAEPQRVLAEIARVLAPDGQFLFIEHVRSDSPRLARWQDRLAGPWQALAAGCRCNRDTLALMRAAGFEAHAQAQRWRAVPPIVAPLVIGRATLAQPSA